MLRNNDFLSLNIFNLTFFLIFQKDLLNSPWYSIETDESTDISVTKLLSFTVRYYSPRFLEVRETFLDLIDIEKADAESLFQHLKNVIDDWGLDPLKFIGLGTDGASVMIGVKQSLWVLAKRFYPNLKPIRCAPHSIDLCARGNLNF